MLLLWRVGGVILIITLYEEEEDVRVCLCVMLVTMPYERVGGSVGWDAMYIQYAYLSNSTTPHPPPHPPHPHPPPTQLCLLGAATVCAIFTGIRGGSFTVAMTRLNMRLRQQLFAALLRQEVGFFDTTRTGDITSRLSADTTTVSDQICLNMNVLFRSMTQVCVGWDGVGWRGGGGSGGVMCEGR